MGEAGVVPTQPPSEFAVAWLSAEAFGAGAWPSGADEPTEPLTPIKKVGVPTQEL